jgi:hypothetical protein
MRPQALKTKKKVIEEIEKQHLGGGLAGSHWQLPKLPYLNPALRQISSMMKIR